MKTLAVLSLSACEPPKDQHAAETKSAFEGRLTTLEMRLAKVEGAQVAQGAAGDWVLSNQNEDLHSSLQSPYPTAEGGFARKADCLKSAANWQRPGGQQVSSDPVILRIKAWQVTLRCLPKGVDPFQRH